MNVVNVLKWERREAEKQNRRNHAGLENFLRTIELTVHFFFRDVDQDA